MGSITINFDNPINVSIQPNDDAPNYNGADIVYYQDSSDNIYRLGACTAVSEHSVTCQIDNTTPRPSADDFIFFVKSDEINTSGIVGYYAEVQMEVESSAKKELFAVNSGVFISS
jgi:hypothetical protein